MLSKWKWRRHKKYYYVLNIAIIFASKLMLDTSLSNVCPKFYNIGRWKQDLFIWLSQPHTFKSPCFICILSNGYILILNVNCVIFENYSKA